MRWTKTLKTLKLIQKILGFPWFTNQQLHVEKKHITKEKHKIEKKTPTKPLQTKQMTPPVPTTSQSKSHAILPVIIAHSTQTPTATIFVTFDVPYADERIVIYNFDHNHVNND